MVQKPFKARAVPIAGVCDLAVTDEEVRRKVEGDVQPCSTRQSGQRRIRARRLPMRLR